MTFQGIQRLAERRQRHRQRHRQRKVFRLWTQFNLKFLLVLMAVAGILCVNRAAIYKNLHLNYEMLMLPSRLRQEAILNMEPHRPIADAYRNEGLSQTEGGGFVLFGECLIEDTWRRFEVASHDGKKVSRSLVLPESP